MQAVGEVDDLVRARCSALLRALLGCGTFDHLDLADQDRIGRLGV